MTDIKRAKLGIPYQVKREAAQLSNCKTKTEVQDCIVDIVNNHDLSAEMRGQILTDLMIRHPQNYIKAVTVLNNMAKNQTVLKSGPSDTLPEFPTEGSDLPDTPTDETTTGDLAVQMLSQSLKDIHGDKHVSIFHTYDGLYDSFDTTSMTNVNAWFNAGMPYNMIAGVGVGVGAIAGTLWVQGYTRLENPFQWWVQC